VPYQIEPTVVADGRRFTYDPKFSQLTSRTDELGRQTLLDIDPANATCVDHTSHRAVGDGG